MNWFRRFAGRGKEPPKTSAVAGPEQVLAALMDASSHKDYQHLIDLCNAYAPIIFKAFASWQKLPEALRKRPNEIQARIHTLVQVATLYEQAGHPELMQSLTALPQESSLEEWGARLSWAHELGIDGQPAASVAAAEGLIADIQASSYSGNIVIDLRARAFVIKSVGLAALDRLVGAAEALRAGIADAVEAGLADSDVIDTYKSTLVNLEGRLALSPHQIDREIRVLDVFALAQRRADLRRHEASNVLLASLLQTDGQVNETLRHLRTHILARMAYNDRCLGRFESAQRLLQQARDVCRELGDHESALVYEENLRVLARSITSDVITSTSKA